MRKIFLNQEKNQNARNYTIDIIRILSCVLIVFDHLSNFMLDGLGNNWYWSNIGVQIFFFISGYLYGGRIISDKRKFLSKQCVKIFKPYWTYLLLFIPIVYYFSPESISIWKSTIAFIGLQGIIPNGYIDSFGQHWFITYILVCYLIITYFSSSINKMSILSLDRFIVSLLVLLIIGQVVTFPLAYFLKFKFAYILTFLVGYFYKTRFTHSTWGGQDIIMEQKKYVDIFIIVLSFIFFPVRWYIENNEFIGLGENIADLTRQYIKLVWAFAIFVLFNNCFKCKNIGNNIKKVLSYLSSITYEVYIVHQFFVMPIYFNLFCNYSILIRVIISILSILFSAILISLISKKIFFSK